MDKKVTKLKLFINLVTTEYYIEIVRIVANRRLIHLYFCHYLIITMYEPIIFYSIFVAPLNPLW